MYKQEFSLSEQHYIEELKKKEKDAWLQLHEDYPNKHYIYLILRIPEFRKQLKSSEYCWYAGKDEKAAIYCCTDPELYEEIGKWGLLELGVAYPKAARALLENEDAQPILGVNFSKRLEENLREKSPIDLPSRFFLQSSDLKSSSVPDSSEIVTSQASSQLLKCSSPSGGSFSTRMQKTSLW